MSFVRRCTIFAILLSIYVFFVNYYLLDYIYIKKLMRATTHIPSGSFYQPLVTFMAAAPSTTQKDFDKNILKRQVTRDRQTPTAAKTAVQNDITNYVPFYHTYKSMIEDDAEPANKSFPEESSCPYLGLRKPYVTSREDDGSSRYRRPNTTCIPRQQSVEECEEAIKYYGKPGTIKEQPCSQEKAVIICSILEDSIREQRRLEISCDFSKCSGKPVVVGLFNDATGRIKNTRLVSSPKSLVRILRLHAASSKFGSGFALLNCAGQDKLQVLTLPKISKGKTKSLRRNEKRLNINIIVEDALSRPHFYRTLSRTASAFREIIHDRSIPATVLDFEMIQSYASMTSYNMRRLFTGRKYIGSGKVYAVEKFFAEFKKRGYTTIFQEEECWYNVWGSMLDPRQKLGVIKNENTRIRRWRDFVEILRNTKRIEAIDDFAMHFLTCHVLSRLRVTNVYDGRKLPKVCFVGRHYSSLLLEYVDKFVSANDGLDQPFIMYTHLDTSHERKGRRIVNDDQTLADLFMKAAHLDNTLTIFTSDHGAKTTPFSTYSTQGREEVFKPFLFMIIPHQVSEVLGVQIMNSLVLNQKLLVGLEDLHYALVSLNNGQKPGGLFQTLPFNRTCEELNLNSDVLCLCQGMDKSVANNSFEVLWAAEYALGTMNNRIQDQYIASLKTKHKGHVTSGYTSACQRYTGLSIARARHMIKGENQTLQFSLFVEPFHIKTVEVFDVQVTFPVQKEMGITLSQLVRVSLFSEYEQCADYGVDPKLCSCHLKRNDTLHWQNELILKAKSKKSFSLQPKSYFLDYPCLSIIYRIHKWLIQSRFLQDAVITYEALNSCAEATYNLTVGTKKVVRSRLSIARPFNVTLFPGTMTFLMTVNNDWKFGKVIPDFGFRRIR